MNDTPAAIPWYRSTVFRGILTIVVTQAINKSQAEFHFDATVLGLGVNEVVGWIMDLISAGALAYMGHGRATATSLPTLTGTKSAADEINVANPAGAPVNAPITPPSAPVSPPAL